MVTFDMGGTTAKALIEHGVYTRALEYQVGAGIIVGSRLLTGGGYMLKVPAIDLAEVGAGGGSHVWIDRGGALQVGPTSAGAGPGPLCYDKGGTEPTVTDANVILGYLNPEYLVGGAVRLVADRAHRIFAEKVARPLGLSLEHAAWGAIQIAASNMMRAIKAVSSERGRDPRGYALLAFGGSGPLFAATMARELGMARVVVPPSPGLLSAFGLLYVEVEHHYTRTFRRLLRDVGLGELNAAWDAMVGDGCAQLAAEGFTGVAAQCRREAGLHYQGQTFNLVVPAPEGPVDDAALAALAEAFGQEHERTYGHRAGPQEPVELVSIKVVARGVGERGQIPERRAGDDPTVPAKPRRAWFGPAAGWLETPVLARVELATPRTGPGIVEEYDATTLVPPGMSARLDAFGNIVIALTGSQSGAAPVPGPELARTWTRPKGWRSLSPRSPKEGFGRIRGHRPRVR